MRKNFISLMVVAAIACFAIQPADAQVFGQTGLGFAARGLTLDPVTGFPPFYTDTLGLSAAQCLDGTANCLPLEGVNPALPLSVPDNFPPEFFYFSGAPVGLVAPAGVTFTSIRFDLEGGWGGAGVPNAGDQAVFQRIRYRVEGLQIDSTLTVVHPWGTDVLTAPADPGAPGTGRVNDTLDIPGLVALAFDVARDGRAIGPLLVGVNPAPPAGYFGTCGGSQTVTGGVGGINSFTISGTSSAGAAFSVTTDLWDICGKLFAGAAREPVATLTRDALGNGTITVTAIGLGTTVPLEIDVTGQVVPLPTEVPPAFIPMGPDPVLAGSFIATIPVGPANNLPNNVIITVDRSTGLPTAVPPGTRGTSLPIPLTDEVIITAATFVGTSATEGTLTVTATSSNKFAGLAPTLTVVTAPLVALPNNVIPATGTLTVTSPTLAAGATVTVTSAPAVGATITAGAGGTDTLPVTVTPFVAAPAPPVTPPGGGGVPAPGVGGGGGGGGGCFIGTLLGN